MRQVTLPKFYLALAQKSEDHRIRMIHIDSHPDLHIFRMSLLEGTDIVSEESLKDFDQVLMAFGLSKV